MVVFPESTVKHGARWIDTPSIFPPHMTQPINECIEQIMIERLVSINCVII